MQESVEEINPVSSLLGKGSIGGVPVPPDHTVEHVSYAMIVMEVLNKVGLSKQQAVMQVRGKLMDVMTRMQNDFTTISEYLSQIENNAHSGGYFKIPGDTDLMGTNAFNGLDNTFYHVKATAENSWDGHVVDSGKILSASDSVSDAFKSSTDGFVNAVKDLFFGSSGGTGLTVADISTITDPHGGPNFDFSGPSGGYWGTLQAGFEKQFPGIGSNMIMTKPTDSPSLLQQYMYYKTQVDVYTLPATAIKNANGEVDRLENFNPDGTAGPNQPQQDALLGTFMEQLAALNTSITSNRDHGDDNYGSDYAAMGGRTSDSLLKLIAENQLKLKVVPGSYIDKNYGFFHQDFYYNQLQPGIYMAVSMMAFNYFWTKTPNAATDQTVTSSTPDTISGGGDGEDFQDSSDNKGSPSSDPLSSLYMTNNSVQTNIGQMCSQSNNNFQSDVNVAGQLDNMGVNSIKSFFEGSTTMNNNCRIS